MLKGVENRTEMKIVPEWCPAHRAVCTKISRAEREIEAEIVRTGGEISRAELQEVARRCGCWIIWEDEKP